MHVQSPRRRLSPWRALSDQSIALALFRNTLSSVLLGAALLFLVATWRWSFVGDASFFHYMVSLLRLGQAPYLNFVDVNLPGTYAVQATVIALLGSGPRAFRFFDFGLLAAISAAMFALCRANVMGRSFAAAFPTLFAATCFALIHGRDGLIHQGQRDLVLAAFYLAACAFLQSTLQRSAKAVSAWRARSLA